MLKKIEKEKCEKKGDFYIGYIQRVFWVMR